MAHTDLEFDRVLGYEANYAGTSFATLDKWRSGNFQYGADIYPGALMRLYSHYVFRLDS